MVDATETLRKLSEKASKLNKSSDEINKIIAAYETKLADMKIGIEFWLGDPDECWADSAPLTISSWSTEYDDEKGEVPGNRTAFARYLGYSKLRDGWQLAIREGNITTGVDATGNRDESFDESMVSKTALVKASREVRIKALGKMAHLFAAMDKKMDDMLGSIEQGKKFLKSIE